MDNSLQVTLFAFGICKYIGNDNIFLYEEYAAVLFTLFFLSLDAVNKCLQSSENTNIAGVFINT